MIILVVTGVTAM